MGFIEKNRSGIVALLVLAAVVAFVFYWRLYGGDQGSGAYNLRKGNYRLEDGQFEEAIREFRLAIDKDPSSAQARLGLALAYMQSGRDDEALEEFGRVLDIEPGHAVAYADRGILLDRLGRYEEALADYRKAMELDAKTAEGPGWLWRFLRNVDKPPPTIRDRAEYLEAELGKPPEERLLRVPEMDEKQRMYKK